MSEEGAWKCLLGVMVIAEYPATDTPPHRSMPQHQGGERRLVTTAEVVLHQLPIGAPCPVAPHRPAKVLDNPVQLFGGHVRSLGGFASSRILVPARLRLIHVFRQRAARRAIFAMPAAQIDTSRHQFFHACRKDTTFAVALRKPAGP